MHILKVIVSLLFFICTLNALEQMPTQKIPLSGGATDIAISDNKLYVSTAMGKIDIFNQSNHQHLESISIEKIKDFMGDLIESKIYSIDVLKEQLLIVAQGEKGGRNVFVYKNKTLTSIIPDTKRLFIAQAKFINDNQFLYATLSNELILYDMPTQKNIYMQQISHSKFSYFALNEDKSSVIIADESGNLQVVKTEQGEIQTTLADQNLDNVFQVDWKNDIILTAGQDRRSVLYSSTNLQPYLRKSGFLIYGCALNQNGTLAAYSSDEQNNVTIYNTVSKKDLYVLKDNPMTISKILFDSNNNIYVGTDANVLNYYKLSKE